MRHSSMSKFPVFSFHSSFSPRGRALWNLIELFTNMDLAQLATIIDKDAIPSLEILPLTGSISLAEASNGMLELLTCCPVFKLASEAVKAVAGMIEEYTQAQAGDEEIDE